jgi:glycosyltransferase involved in cell wall biosynthesis
VKITAILNVRNESPYIANCLNHLVENGLDFIVIDNDSNDGTDQIVESEVFRPHLLELVNHPYPGYFDWEGLMRARETAAAECDSDWVVFVSADEIMHSYRRDESLAEAIQRVAEEEGADVIDFNEFVFLPVENDYVSDLRGSQPGLHYYFFEPCAPRLMRARRRDLDVSQIEHGGHRFSGADFTLAKESFALRHYVFRDQHHAWEKYEQRRFAQSELDRGWHRNRIDIDRRCFDLPDPGRLHRLRSADDRDLDRSRPESRHYWQWKQG